ncbi:iron-sulfur cluster carrier protein [Paenibacillus baekrokdamisoli]|uniref:Iron-sulfur cluster carrier protein n=1 Tax=Paenibacillus baekrokdamisoli TaxID=1712516 RepID=A0A3G9J0G0_9BACL|nr:Mrp/NBP35 family ATP-binding protein [Paenibacillus baekrokdamisoli]MBB3073087.1 ATP-binding protein involved in chromosome partitioning [Paenibacillus baekrokdamisoli]BBH24032.1 iron-sulfur cluster carrier protein [Paenibacillus baekrokdamisoli]
MLSREEIQQTAESIAVQYSTIELSIAIRDVMVRERNVSLTIVGVKEGELSALEGALRQSLSEAGAETVHFRFRAGEPTASSQSASNASNVGSGTAKSSSAASAASAGQGPVRGHGAGMEAHPLLHAGSGVHFIAVASGKGGVGKSTVTVNLAVALARKGKRVGIIDADIYGFSVPDMMGIEDKPEVINERVIPIEKFGVRVMSMGFFVEDNAPIVWRGPMLGKMLRNFFAEIEWGELDYLLLDLPPGTGDVALDVHQLIPQSKEIIVTTPHATAAFVAARAGAMAIKTEHEIIGIVENMSYFASKSGEIEYVFGRGGGARLAESLHSELLAQIPLGAPDNLATEPDFAPSVYKAETETGQIYLQIADRVIAKCEG